MESRIQRIFLSRSICMMDRVFTRSSLAVLSLFSLFSLLLFCGIPLAQAKDEADIEPLPIREVERRDIDVDQIDTENFELGVTVGLLDVEDFGSHAYTGIRAAYHITEDFFVEGTYGTSKLGQTSFERLSGGARLLTNKERDLTYYNAAIGWNVLPGESFVGSRLAFKSSLYLLVGAGATKFGGDDVFTINAGVGYRLVMLDWLALHVTARDHMWESDLLGESDNKHNIEVIGGVTVFF